MTMAKVSYFGELERLAQVCCDVVEGKLQLGDEPTVKFFKKKKRSLLIRFPRKQEENMIKINNLEQRNLSLLPPKRLPLLHLEDDMETGVKRRSSKRKRGVIAGPKPPPAMPDNLMATVVREFDVSTVSLVIQKRLFKTDLMRIENRLSMTLNQIMSDDFLMEEEKRTLERRRPDNRKECIAVDLIEPNEELRRTKMELRKWDFSNSSSYVLTHNWFKVAERNGLQEKQILQIWFFRTRDGKPCFALVNLGPEAASSSSSGEDDHERSSSEPGSTITA